MEQPPRNPSFTWVFAIVLVLALGLTAGGIYLASRGQGWALLASGAGCTVGTLLAWAIAGQIGVARASAAEQMRQALLPLSERLEQFSVMLNLIAEQQLLSDRGKAIAYRSKDREALRFAVQEDIARGDFEAARKLADEMELSFGNKQEADHFRAIIDDKRTEHLRKQIGEATAAVEKLIRAEQWPAAQREAEQVRVRFGDHELVRNLVGEVDNRRQQLKKQLLDGFHEAVHRRDTDAALELLKRLDPYLSSTEAEALQETARGVLKAKLEQLKEQFATAVHQGKWHEALRVGDAIVRDHPNTQMAREVREHMDTLRQRAGEVVAAT